MIYNAKLCSYISKYLGRKLRDIHPRCDLLGLYGGNSYRVAIH